MQCRLQSKIMLPVPQQIVLGGSLSFSERNKDEQKSNMWAIWQMLVKLSCSERKWCFSSFPRWHFGCLWFFSSSEEFCALPTAAHPPRTAAAAPAPYIQILGTREETLPIVTSPRFLLLWYRAYYKSDLNFKFCNRKTETMREMPIDQ